MDWQTFLNSPLAIWIPILVLVGILIIAFRKQIGGLIDRTTSARVEAGAEGTKVNIEAPTPPSAQRQATAAPAEPAPQPHGAVIRDAESSEGGALAEDQFGQGALIERVKTKDDLIASSTPPPGADPKAPPPA